MLLGVKGRVTAQHANMMGSLKKVLKLSQKMPLRHIEGESETNSPREGDRHEHAYRSTSSSFARVCQQVWPLLEIHVGTQMV